MAEETVSFDAELRQCPTCRAPMILGPLKQNPHPTTIWSDKGIACVTPHKEDCPQQGKPVDPAIHPFAALYGAVEQSQECSKCEGLGWIEDPCATPWCSDASHSGWSPCPVCNPDGKVPLDD